jgi:hypothetical protein
MTNFLSRPFQIHYLKENTIREIDKMVIIALRIEIFYLLQLKGY